MPSTFSQAFGAITKASSSVYESLRERILPTPGKRKREKEIEVPLGSDRAKRLMKVGVLYVMLGGRCSRSSSLGRAGSEAVPLSTKQSSLFSTQRSK